MKNKNFETINSDAVNSHYEETLMRTALSTKYKDSDISNIMRVATSTGNAQLAIAMLLDLYVEPEINKYIAIGDPKTLKGDNQRRDLQLVQYNPFTDIVTYRYFGNKCTSAWVPREEYDDEKISMENYSIITKTRWYDDAAKEIGMHPEEFRKTHVYEVIESEWNYSVKLEGECTLGKWIEMTNLSEE